MGAWIVAGIVVLACWVGLSGARRRARRRETEARVRARARKPRVPLVSANVRGQPNRRPDIWRDEADALAQKRPTDG